MDLNSESSKERFEARLEDALSPGQSAKELVEQIVRAALEAEFGIGFTGSKGFAKMVSTIADTIVVNPELRRQSLSVASSYIGKKVKVTRIPPRTEGIKKLNDGGINGKKS